MVCRMRAGIECRDGPQLHSSWLSYMPVFAVRPAGLSNSRLVVFVPCRRVWPRCICRTERVVGYGVRRGLSDSILGLLSLVPESEMSLR